MPAVLAQERPAQAEEEFGEDKWESALELDKTGNVKNTLRSLTLILENGLNLKPLGLPCQLLKMYFYLPL